MAVEDMGALLSAVLGNLEDDVTEANVVKFQEHIDTIAGIVASIEEAFGDGLDFSDLHVIGQVVGPIMKLASNFGDFEGEDKKTFVQEVVWAIYTAIDKGPNGDQNNVNVPWLVGALETKVEKKIIKFAAGMAVDALFKRMRDADEV
jgi:hypothetical protein